MSELILYNLISSKLLIITFLATLFTIGCIVYWSISKFRLKKGKIKLYGLLLEISDKDIFVLSLILVRTFIIMYYLIVYQQNVTMSLTMVAIVSIAYIMCNLKNILYESINAIAIMAIIYFMNVLDTYMIEVAKSTSVQIVKLALMAFSIMYTIYISLKSVEDVVSKEKDINK